VRFCAFSLERDYSSLKTEAPRLSDNSSSGRSEFLLLSSKSCSLGQK